MIVIGGRHEVTVGARGGTIKINHHHVGDVNISLSAEVLQEVASKLGTMVGNPVLQEKLEAMSISVVIE